MEHPPTSGLQQALHFLRGHEENQKHDETDIEDEPLARTQDAGGEEDVGSGNLAAETLQDSEETGDVETGDESHDLQKGEENIPARDEGDDDAEYVIDRLIDHGFEERKLVPKVRWYG